MKTEFCFLHFRGVRFLSVRHLYMPSTGLQKQYICPVLWVVDVCAHCQRLNSINNNGRLI